MNFNFSIKSIVIIFLNARRPKSDYSSYRPIILFNLLLKLLEKIIYKQLLKTMAESNTTPPYHFRFRPQNSPVYQIVENIVHNFLVESSWQLYFLMYFPTSTLFGTLALETLTHLTVLLIF